MHLRVSSAIGGWKEGQIWGESEATISFFSLFWIWPNYKQVEYSGLDSAHHFAFARKSAFSCNIFTLGFLLKYHAPHLRIGYSIVRTYVSKLSTNKSNIIVYNYVDMCIPASVMSCVYIHLRVRCANSQSLYSDEERKRTPRLSTEMHLHCTLSVDKPAGRMTHSLETILPAPCHCMGG